MRAYTLPLSCPCCATELEHVTSSNPIAGTEATAVAKCHSCGREWQVLVHLRHIPNERTAERSELRRQRKAEAEERAAALF